MATLEKIRSKAGMLVTVIGLALFAFIVGDLFTGGQSFWRQSKDKVLTINGERITTDEFAREVDDLTEIYQMQSGQNSLPSEYVQQINNQVYDNIVRETLITDEADKIGMTVSKEELKDMVSGDHISPMLQQMPFFRNQQTGQFDKSLLMNFLQTVVSIQDGADGAAASQELQQARKFWMFWEKTIKKQRLEEKFNTLLSKAIMPNSLDTKAQYEAGKESVDFAYAVQSFASIPDSTVTISKSELTSLYDKQKDARFKQGETRAVKYFSVDILPSKSDFETTEEEINKARPEFVSTTSIADYVNANSEVPYVDAYVAISSMNADEKKFAETSAAGEVYGPYLDDNTYKMFRMIAKTSAPDSIKARHIMLPIQDEAKAVALADSLLTALNGGSDFAALAEKFSADRNSASRGGEIGWFTESDAVRGIGVDFKNACFSAPLNKYFTVRTTYGIHVAQVTEATKNVAKAKVAVYALQVSPSSRTFQQLYSKINQFIATNNTPELIEKNASEGGYNVMTNDRLQTTDNNLGMIQNARQPIRWAFQNKAGKVSEIFEVDNKFVVVAVTGSTKAGYASLEQATPALRFELMNKKKAEMITKNLEGKKLASLSEYATAMNTRVDTAKFVSFNTTRIAGVGNEPVLAGMAPYATVNTITGPVAGNNGVYVFSVYNKTANETPYNAENEKQSIEANLTYRLMYQSMEVLKNHAKIEDNRIIMF